MRFKLFAVEIERPSGTSYGHIAAPDDHHALRLIIDHDETLGQEHSQVIFERVDQKLPRNQKLRLDDLLEAGQAGFVYFCPGVGWLPQPIGSRRLSLYRFEVTGEENKFIAASSADAAVAIYYADRSDPNTPLPAFQVYDGLADLSRNQVKNLRNMLEFGPPGELEFDEKYGWMRW